MKQSIKKPKESRAELTDSVTRAMAGWDKVVTVRFLLTFFTSVDLQMILNEINAKEIREPTLPT
jgi:hypothetical protein